MKLSVKAVAVLGLLAISLVAPRAQQAQNFIGASNTPATNDPFLRSTLGRRMLGEQMRERNIDRQKHLESDANRIVDLGEQLQRGMQGEKALSPDDLNRRAAEIEKLARSVRERMKGDS
jgi:hypothetical protein